MIREHRHRVGWAILVLVAVVPLAFGVKGLLTGLPGNPAVIKRLTGVDWAQLQAEQLGVSRLVGLLARHEAVAFLGWGTWLLISAFAGYRTGQRWLWYAWWTMPVLILAIVATGEGVGGALRPALVTLALLTVLGLILARRA